MEARNYTVFDNFDSMFINKYGIVTRVVSPTV